MRAGSSLRVVIDGREIQALHIPRQAVFEKNGKNYVFLQVGPDRFDRRDIKVENRTESRAVVSGLNEGDVIALIDPDIATQRSKASSGPLPASSGPAK